MNRGQLSLTRRALLAGACAAPAVAGGAVLESKGEARWRLALDRFREADARLAAAAHGDDERLYDRLGARHDSAIKALLRTPAPTLVALAFKVDLLILEQAWELTGGELCLGSLRRDVYRFAGG
jgi:hypothetical protein